MNPTEKAAEALWKEMFDPSCEYPGVGDPMHFATIDAGVAFMRTLAERGSSFVEFGRRYLNFATDTHFLEFWKAMIDQAIKEGE